MSRAACAVAREAVELAYRSRQEVDFPWLAPSSQRNQWSLDDDTLSFVTRLVATLRPQRIVEFGSGESTRALARAAAVLDPPAKVVALENDPLFRRRTRRALAEDGSAKTAEVRLTPVVVRRWFGNNVPVYHLTKPFLSATGRPDLVVVDGPPLPLGGREGSLLQAVHLGQAGTVVVLDDASRPSEEKALKRVVEVCGEGVELFEFDDFPKGLVILMVNEMMGASAMPPPPSTDGSTR
jgi:predicted O-methyltransferase YrrM